MESTGSLGTSPRRTLTLAAILYGCSLILFDIAPFYVGMYVDRLGISLSEAGFIQTIDQAGGVLGAIVGFFLMPRLCWKRIILAAFAVAIVANALTAVTASYLLLCLVRLVAGFGVILITTVTACILARAVVPDRAFGAGLALGMGLTAAAIWLLDAVRADFGIPMAFASGAAWLCAGSLFAFLLPSGLGGKPDAPVLETHADAEAVGGDQRVGQFALIALLLFATSVNIVYGFVERIGLANGLGQSAVATALALGFIFSAVGSLVPAVFGSLGGRMKWIALTTLVFLGSLGALYAAKTGGMFTLAFAVYASAWNMGLAYYMSMTAENDPEHRYTRMIYIVNVAAQSLGPAIGASVLVGASLSAVFIIAPLPAVLAALLAYFALQRINHKPKALFNAAV